jgi:hypothetical protein
VISNTVRKAARELARHKLYRDPATRPPHGERIDTALIDEIWMQFVPKVLAKKAERQARWDAVPEELRRYRRQDKR